MIGAVWVVTKPSPQGENIFVAVAITEQALSRVAKNVFGDNIRRVKLRHSGVSSRTWLTHSGRVLLEAQAYIPID